jgi:hypothetical protein
LGAHGCGRLQALSVSTAGDEDMGRQGSGGAGLRCGRCLRRREKWEDGDQEAEVGEGLSAKRQHLPLHYVGCTCYAASVASTVACHVGGRDLAGVI